MNDDKEAFAKLGTVIVPLIEKAFLTLLENKHLYQSVVICVVDIFSDLEKLAGQEVERRRRMETMLMPSSRGSIPVKSKSKEEIVHEYIQQAEDFLRRLPYIMKLEGRLNELHNPIVSYESNIAISVQTVRTYCSHPECGGLWPHNPCPDPSLLIPTSMSGKNLQQVFVLRYQCQNCKKDPVTFLVKRDGLKLALSGRSPIEEIEVPQFIPKEIRKFYRGAVLAFHCGAYLPSLFMLRTTIEQHMRHAIGAGDRRMTGDELTDAYASSLPQDFNTRYQSLKPVYVALSDAIHAARDNDAQLFETERKRVLAHFEAKEVFERLSGRLETGANKTAE